MKTFTQFKAEQGIGPGFPFRDGEVAWNAAVAACAEMVRAAGCLCHLMEDSKARWAWPVVDTTPGDGFSGRIVKLVDQHDPRCPEAIVLAIEARGKE